MNTRMRFLLILSYVFFGSALASETSSSKIVYLKNWTFSRAGAEDWHKAAVPGCVHTDLLAAGLIPDPFFRDNEHDLDWIGKTSWDYECTFYADSSMLDNDCIEILFKGLDTYCDVFFNDSLILSCDNMFRPWAFDIKPVLEYGTNSISVRFYSPINRILPHMKTLSYTLPASNDRGEKTSPYTRKAPYHFGWDWGPRFVTCGIWKPVLIQCWNTARITDVFIEQKCITEAQAQLSASIYIEAQESGFFSLSIADEETGTALFCSDVSLSQGLNIIRKPFTIHNPELWWPNNLGCQNLYSFTASLRRGDVLYSVKSRKTGLRTIELVQDKTPEGRTFFFKVNGVPVFAKGGNWIPADSFTPRIPACKYRWLLGSCKTANMNMVRVWGGGIYEPDLFYDLCDSLGLLVWQDFMFSCSMYPGTEQFFSNVSAEAVFQVKRLRNHPCIALFCGNNEIEVAYNNWGWKEKLPEKVWYDYKMLFHELLPDVCRKHSPGTVYWPSSPSSNLEAPAADQKYGDTHYWEVWHGGKPFSAYKKQYPNFMSEYGFQSFPSMNTVKTWALECDMSLDSPVMQSHQKHPRGNQLIESYMEDHFRKPKDFESFLYASQVLQAKGIKTAAEHLRKNMPVCMGSLYWQINDCWPVASWSGIDYYGTWKALHYYAKRFYAPVSVVPEYSDKTLNIHVISDRTDTFDASLETVIISLKGDTVWSVQADVTVQPCSSVCAYMHSISEYVEGLHRKQRILYCSLKPGDGSRNIIADNVLLFCKPKDLSLSTKPDISFSIAQVNSGFDVTVMAQNLVMDVYLHCGNIKGRFSDNFVTLVPGMPVTTHFVTNEDLSIDRFRETLKFLSINTSTGISQ